MRKISIVALISLAAAAAVSITGGVVIARSDLNLSEVYDIVGENIEALQTNTDFSKTPDVDLSRIDGMTETEYVTYQLNEFNTLCVFADSCTLKLAPTSSDELVISLNCPQKAQGHMAMQTAVKGGCLYVKYMWYGEPTAQTDEVELTVGIPENYKGGYSINGTAATLNLGSIDSSMDVNFNLYNCTAKADDISAKEVELEISGGSLSAESVTAYDVFEAESVSSNVNISRLESKYSTVKANSSTINLSGITGGLSADVQICKANFDWLAVTGNITLKASAGETELAVPKGSNVTLRHDESWAKYKNNINSAPLEENDENSYYIIDTNVEFGIVTLSEK